METPETVSVLVSAKPYLLATAPADMLGIEGFKVRVVEDTRSLSLEEHACVILLDATAPAAAHIKATVRLPEAFADGALTVELGGRRFKTRITRPRELMPLIAALATEAACCTRVSLAAG